VHGLGGHEILNWGALLAPGCCDPYKARKVLRAACGAVFAGRWAWLAGEGCLFAAT
jgi:hypothetical protein